jgi:alkylation response protein AidB-like acyl-CoA dehydrogenase
VDGAWRLEGQEKYFASNAGLADLALVTARPEGAPPGPKGLALFLVPRLREDRSLNYLVRRFKEKSATRAVPTGEVELQDSMAYVIGDPGLGIYYTLETLTVSRLANAIGAMGLARKAQFESLFRVHARQAFGEQLIEHPLVRRDLTEIALRNAGGLALIFHAIAHFDAAWDQAPPYSAEYHYARFLSHLAKNCTADHAAEVTRLAMEIFGGLGFLDEYAVARLHREALITPIWEGTSNIQALDLLEVMQKKSAHESFMDEITPLLGAWGTPEAKRVREHIEATLAEISAHEPRTAQWHGKDALKRLGEATQAALLYKLAEVGGERYEKLAKLYAHRFVLGEACPEWALDDPAIWCPSDQFSLP